MKQIRVQIWAEVIERLHDRSWQPAISRFRSTYVSCGSADACSNLTTSLTRLGGDYPSLEEPLLRTFRRYGRWYEPLEDAAWNWLALAQHHRLPTRLLDWTYSPFVSLYFATVDLSRYERDGAVWCVDYTEVAALLPDALPAVLEEEGAQVFTTEMLDVTAPTLPELDRLSDRPFVRFFEPPSLDDRIVNQHALFSLMSGASARLDRWVAKHPSLARQIVIPASLKWEVRDKPDQANYHRARAVSRARWPQRVAHPLLRPACSTVSSGAAASMGAVAGCTHAGLPAPPDEPVPAPRQLVRGSLL